MGGGILCRNGSDPTICYNIIKMNNTVEGGGCAFIDSDPYFCRNQVINNEAVRGGGLMLDNSSTEIAHCVFAKNIASEDAGGILMITANQPTIKSSVFYQNRGMSIGSIDCSNSMADITHNCFFGTEGIDSVSYTHLTLPTN